MGRAVARAFAREGARVFLAGRTREPFEALPRTSPPKAEVAVVEALEEQKPCDDSRRATSRSGENSIESGGNCVRRQ